MKKYKKVLENSGLFQGMREDEIDSMLRCLDARAREYEKGQYVYRTGDRITRIGMVLEGMVYIGKEDYWGNKSILAEISQGELLGEVYACMDGEPSAVHAAAARRSVVLFMDMKKVLSTCTSICPHHSWLIQNFVKVMAYKNRNLTRKIEHLTQRTTREKLLSYLSEQSMKAGTASFEIPFDRQQLADYLSVDRSAMSKALGMLKQEGILEYKKSRFTLLPQEARTVK